MSTRRTALLALVLALLCGLFLSSCSGPDAAGEHIPDGRIKITLAAVFMYDNYPLRQVVNGFNESQEDIWVEIVTYMDPEFETDVDAAAQRMYASFTSGRPADLYLRMDVYKLRNAGLITDWYPIMRADTAFDFNDYQTHIWELFESDGALYHLAVSFDLFGIGGPEELYGGRTGWTYDEFRTFLAENSDMTSVDQERFLQYSLWYGTQFSYVDPEAKTCEFECASFYDWLALLKELPLDYPQEQEIGPARIQGLDSHDSNYRRNGYYVRVVGVPTPDASGPGVAIQDGFALSSQTAHPEACWAFVKWLLAPEQQERYYSWGVPMSKAVWESQLERAALDGSNENSLFAGSRDLSAEPILVDGEWQSAYHPGMPQEEIDYVRQAVADASYITIGFHDYEDITYIVEEEVLAYLAGDKSAEECARIIQSRVSTLLAERQ